MYYVLKIVITAVVVVAIAEVAKRHSWIAAILASLPLTSILAMVWLYLDTGDADKVAMLSRGVFWMVLPSLVFFLTLPLLIRLGLNFYLSLATASGVMVVAYWAYVNLLGRLGIEI